MNVLIDSSVLIALFDTEDKFHKRAITEMTKLYIRGNKSWISEHVLDEVLNILLKRNMIKKISILIQNIQEGNIFVFTPETSNSIKIRNSVIKLLINQGKKRASFTDLYSVVLINDEYIIGSRILSFDKHHKSE